MPGFEMLEVAIGLVLVYLVLSLLATSIGEILTQWRDLRGKNLRQAIEVLVGEDTLAASADKPITRKLFEQPTIRTLTKPRRKSQLSRFIRKLSERFGKTTPTAPDGSDADSPVRRDPSYIPSEVFAKALLDVVSDGEARRIGTIPNILRQKLEDFAGPPSADGKETPRQFLSRTLLGFYDEAGGDYDQLLKQIRQAFDNTGQRATGWFKRSLSWQLISIGLAIAVLANADTLKIIGLLQEDPELRKTAMELAMHELTPSPQVPDTRTGRDRPDAEGRSRVPQGAQPTPRANADPGMQPAPGQAQGSESDEGSDAETSMERIKEKVGALEPFLGWDQNDPFVTAWRGDQQSNFDRALAFLSKFLGLLLTAFAISLGAPFWFDLLQKLMRVRNSLKPEEEAAAQAKQEQPTTVEMAGAPGAILAPTAARGESRMVAREPGYGAGMRGFVPFTAEYQSANNYWLACASKLAYADADTVADRCRSWGLRLLLPPLEDSKGDTQVFIAADDNVAILAFRGTEPNKPADILTDVRVRQVAPGWDKDPREVRVHQGFRDALDDVWQKVEQTVRDLDRKQAIWLAGHSLGGALALLCGYRLHPLLEVHNEQARTARNNAQLLGSIFGVYTIGQPRCGNREFVEEAMRRLPGKIFRTINNRDIVPRIPTRTMGYRHAGSVRYIDELGKVHSDPGLWLRLLDTLLVSPEDIKDRAIESVKDHNVDEYVAHLHAAMVRP